MENTAFRRFVHNLSGGTYKPPSRGSISEILVPEVYDVVNTAVQDRIKQADFYSLSTDGWSDNRRRAIVNMMAHIPRPLHFRSIDTKGNTHSGKLFNSYMNEVFLGAYIADLLDECIIAIGPQQTIAVIADHALNMRVALETLERRYPWLITSGCKGHCLHLAVCDLLKLAIVAAMIDICKDLVKLFR